MHTPLYIRIGHVRPAGQMQNDSACETLEKVLGNTSDDCMVRHEVNINIAG